jgi:hypothetical protein
MEVLFSIERKLFAVFRDVDGFTTCSEYDGKKVRASFPSDDRMRCVLLLDPDATEKPRFENLFCVDGEGNTLWTGKLPQTHDRFISAHMEPDGLHAWSWSCRDVTFDPATGRVIREVFMK